MTLAWLLAQFALCALLIARAGFVPSTSADCLVGLYDWGRGWVGLALLGLYLPALRSVHAHERHALQAGPLLADAAAVHAGTAVTALVMTVLVIVGLAMRPQARVLRVTSWVSVGLVAAYVINAALVHLTAG